jgi:hypothetical protein
MNKKSYKSITLDGMTSASCSRNAVLRIGHAEKEREKTPTKQQGKA